MAFLPYVSICSGGGGLDRGVHAALVRAGHTPRCVLYCEREAFDAAHLVAEMEAGRLDPAPIWSDCTAVPTGVREHLRRLAGRHRLGLVGGIPCQPNDAEAWAEVLEASQGLAPATADPEPDRAAMLRLLGNGVVPEQAEEAVSQLLERNN